MTPNVMREQLAEAVKLGGGYCVLKLLAGRLPTGFPRGELLNEHADGTRVYRFETWRVVRWIDAFEKDGEGGA